MNKGILAGLCAVVIVIIAFGFAFNGSGDEPLLFNDVPSTSDSDIVEINYEAPEIEEIDYVVPDALEESVDYTIEMEKYSYSIGELTVKVRDTVTWVNVGDREHFVLSRRGPRVLDSGNIKVGESYEYTFTEVAEYWYFDAYYKNMFGKIIVVE